MENKILYGVGQGFSELGKIVEFLIVKETPKTFIVKEKCSTWSNWERTVKKSSMTVGSIYSYKLVNTYSEAIEFSKHCIQERIKSKIKSIENSKKEIEELTKKLKELEGNNEKRT